MSYSRWIASDWYIYWSTPGDEKDKQPKLAIWSAHHTELFYATYDRLRKAKGDYSFVHKYEESNAEQKKHCDECIDEFITDVEWQLMRDKLGEDPILIDDWRPDWFDEDLLKHFSENTIKSIKSKDCPWFDIVDGKIISTREQM